MDGEQAGLSQSLQFRLARAISLAVAAMATVAGILSFRATLDEVHEFQDEILEQAAELLGPESGQATASLPVQGCLQTDDDEEGLIIQRLPALPKDGQDRKDRKQPSVTDTVTKDSRANDGPATSVRPSGATRTSDAKLSSGSRNKDEDDDDDEARCLPLPMAALLMALPARAQEGALASLPHDLSPLGMQRVLDGRPFAEAAIV